MAKKKDSRTIVRPILPTVAPPEYSGLAGSHEKPTGPDESWRRIAAARNPAFDQSVPAYLLDEKYWFLDWNPSFDELIAQPLGLKRLRNHAEDFVARLENVDDVYKRSKEVFDGDHAPDIDLEPLKLRTERFGLIEFQKIAVQISDSRANLSSWCVYLNITSADRIDELWKALQRRLETDLNWSRYSVSYDMLLRDFDDNSNLLDLVVGKLKGCKRCLDLGAGTGNGTLRLLQSWNERIVWAIESNHAMVQQLIAKIERSELERNHNYFGRLHVLKENLQRLDDLHDFLTPGSFDGALLANVLYALPEPEKCLREVHALLRKGGKIVLSTSHNETDVRKLFERMKDVLTRKGLFDQLSTNFEDAFRRHSKMDADIHRDTKDGIRRYVENAGFVIVDWRDREYVDAVVVVEAIKP